MLPSKRFTAVAAATSLAALLAACGSNPTQPVASWGWGSIPDQFGRESSDELDLEP